MADSVRRIFLCEGVVQGRSRSGTCGGQRENSKKVKKRRVTKSTVTPTHNAFRHSELDTVADSARRIILLKAIVQGRSRSGVMCTHLKLKRQPLNELRVPKSVRRKRNNTGTLTKILRRVNRLNLLPFLLELPGGKVRQRVCDLREIARVGLGRGCGSTKKKANHWIDRNSNVWRV